MGKSKQKRRPRKVRPTFTKKASGSSRSTTSPILMKFKDEDKSRFFERMARQNWINLDTVDKHWMPKSNELHAGPLQNCYHCEKRGGNVGNPVVAKKQSPKVNAIDSVKEEIPAIESETTKEDLENGKDGKSEEEGMQPNLAEAEQELEKDPSPTEAQIEKLKVEAEQEDKLRESLSPPEDRATKEP